MRSSRVRSRSASKSSTERSGVPSVGIAASALMTGGSGVTVPLRTAEASSGVTEGFLSITGGLFLSSNNSATVLSGVPEASADLSKAAC